jgi:phosphatidate cytidylyltransferase
MTRLVTGLSGAILLLGATFLLPSAAYLGLWLVLAGGAGAEYGRLARRLVPSSPMGALAVAAPTLGAATAYLLPRLPQSPVTALGLLLGVLLVLWLLAALVVLTATPISEAFLALGMLSFGLPYLALPPVALYWLHAVDPWLLVLLFAVVWGGDTAAFYVGTRFGRHRMAPAISPKKSWEGAVAGLVAAVLAGVVWSTLRLGTLDSILLLTVGAAAAAGQLGDLVVSLLKRAAGVKDSGRLLPGHGGLLDRFDALYAAAPCLAWALVLYAPAGPGAA